MSEQNKVAIVTGGSGGIGSEIARQLAAKGISVILTYSQHQEKANQLVSEIESAGGKAKAFALNVTDSEQVSACFEFAKSEFGRIDIVVNNAGTIIPAPIANCTDDMFKAVFDVNTFGAFTVMRESAKHLQDNGRILNTSTIAVTNPIAGGGLYSASKAAMEILGKSLSRELGERGITVNSMRVGSVVPGMFEKAPPERQAAMANASPFKRLGTPDDIAKVVSFLVSDDAAWITGEVITIDGGVS